MQRQEDRKGRGHRLMTPHNITLGQSSIWAETAVPLPSSQASIRHAQLLGLEQEQVGAIDVQRVDPHGVSRAGLGAHGVSLGSDLSPLTSTTVKL